MIKKRFISMLVLLAAVATGAMAQTETLLTTITATAKEQASYSTANVATVSFSYTSGGSSAYLANWGWWGYGWIATVTAAEGYTITKCIFYDDANRTATDSEAPFVVETTEEDKTPRINGTPIDGGNNWSKGIKKIEVYGYAAPATVNVTGVTLAPTSATLTLGETETVTLIPTVLPGDATDKSVTWSSSDEAVATVTDGVVTAVAAGTATITVTTTDGAKTATCAVTVAAPAASTYTVTLKEGTEDATSWTIAPAEATTTGVAAGTTVTATYSGTKKVKSVKAVKKAAASIPLDNTTTAWTAGSYAVPAGGLTYSDAITVSGDVTLTLTDGETLTLNKGISLASGATLTVEGNGAMVVNGTNNSTASTVAGSTGTLILTSGTLTATGGKGQDMTDDFETGASGGAAINGSVTVNGGSLTAKGGNGGNCIGDLASTHGGAGGAAISGDVTITDGAVAATGGNGGSINGSDAGYDVHGGAGGAAIGGNATLTGGTLTTTQGANGTQTGYFEESSVGAGGKAVAGTVTNNGGTVN